MLVTVLSVALSALILVGIIYKMIQIRQRRFLADEWLQQNQAKITDYALMTKDSEMDEITQVLEKSKIQAEISTGKSMIRQEAIDKI